MDYAYGRIIILEVFGSNMLLIVRTSSLKLSFIRNNLASAYNKIRAEDNNKADQIKLFYAWLKETGSAYCGIHL